jgi:photosystem II stability/assembly factor-like uncharacterized protein
MKRLLTSLLIFLVVLSHKGQITQLISGTNVYLRDLSVIGSNIMIGGITNNYIRKSYDECDNLSVMPCPGLSTNYNHLQRLDTSKGFLCSYGNNFQLYRTTDGGYNWSKRMDTTAFSGSTFVFFDENEGLTDKGIMNNLLRTTNGGAAWTATTMPLYDMLVAEAYSDSIVLIGGSSFPNAGGECYLSKDRGHTWPYYCGLNSLPTDFFFLNKDTIFITQQPSTVGPTAGIAAYAVSINKGSNWQSKDAPIYYPNGVFFKNKNEGYIIGSNQQNQGVIAKTTDFCNTWSTFNTSINTRLTNMAVLNDSIALLTGSNGVLLRWNYKISVFTSVNENSLELNGLKLYPNPVSNKLSIDNPGVPITSLSIFNTLGEIVFKELEPKQEIETSFLKSGIYFVKVENKSGFKTFKIIKEQ